MYSFASSACLAPSLHSILDIFQFTARKEHLRKIFLYIPFWIYSNIIAFSDILGFYFLYIPFWIYSNFGKSKPERFKFVFTFHSGYILIRCRVLVVFIEDTLHSTLVSSIGYIFHPLFTMIPIIFIIFNSHTKST